MIKSMTGFSRSRVNCRFGSISLEISSFNHRNQEISVRSPRELSSFEQIIHQEIRKASKRGKIQARIDICMDSALRAARIDREILDGYIREISGISLERGFQREVEIEQLLSLPGVLIPAQNIEEDMEKDMEGSVMVLVANGLSDWNSMRSVEGEHLQKNIIEQMDRFEALLSDIASKWTFAKERASELLKTRIRLLLENTEPGFDEGRIAQEIVILNDKWDISEELARLASHVDKFRSIVHNETVSGKTLDFLVQEMNREINTIASKVQDAEIRWVSVEAKSCLESIREQVQNVE